MKYLLIGIEVVVGLLLIGVILLQRSKDQGLGLAFGAGMGESLFGSQAVNVLIKITVVLACIFFLNTMILAHMMHSKGAEGRPVPVQQQRTPAGAPGASAIPDGAQPAGAPADAGASAPQAAAQPFAPAAPAAGTESASPMPPSPAPVPVAP
ncbi:MAG: preprotein translocase subunit SecG [bacterium]